MTVSAYPLRTHPFFRDYLWGGRRLQTILGKQIPAGGVWAESWEVVDHPEHSSVIDNGELAGKNLSQIVAADPHWLMGDHAAHHRSLPLLFKYLDCQRVLSVQVHPDDDYGLKMSPPDLGKTEAWYIMAAEPGAVLYAGLKSGVSAEELQRAVETGTVESCLHQIQPQAGDCVFIPAGTVHALGAGLLVAEIQQASNTTFRLFDWNRVDANGNPRQLHVSQSMEVIDFESGPRPMQTPQPTDQPARQRLVECEKFVLDRWQASPGAFADSWKVAGDGRLHLLTVPAGGVQLSWDEQSEILSRGQTVLLPAALPTVAVQPLDETTTLLDMYLPSIA